MSNRTIKLSEKNYNKIMDIKELNGLKSADHVLDKILPKGSVTENDFMEEPPAFTIKNHIVSWEDLKKSQINTTWQSNDETENATIIFKDKFGALIRFHIFEDFFIEYYHFL